MTPTVSALDTYAVTGPRASCVFFVNHKVFSAACTRSFSCTTLNSRDQCLQNN